MDYLAEGPKNLVQHRRHPIRSSDNRSSPEEIAKPLNVKKTRCALTLRSGAECQENEIGEPDVLLHESTYVLHWRCFSLDEVDGVPLLIYGTMFPFHEALPQSRIRRDVSMIVSAVQHLLRDWELSEKVYR